MTDDSGWVLHKTIARDICGRRRMEVTGAFLATCCLEAKMYPGAIYVSAWTDDGNTFSVSLSLSSRKWKISPSDVPAYRLSSSLVRQIRRAKESTPC